MHTQPSMRTVRWFTFLKKRRQISIELCSFYSTDICALNDSIVRWYKWIITQHPKYHQHFIIDLYINSNNEYAYITCI